MSVMDVVPIVLLAALLGLDVVTFPQAMISRPVVAATAAGAFLDNAFAGLMIGAVLELIALGMLPFGASKYPEWGSASVVGGALFAAQHGSPPGALAVSVLAALLTAVVSGWSMVKLRRINAFRATRLRSELDAGSANAIVGLQIFGLTADFVRGGLVALAAMLVFRSLVPAVVAAWNTGAVYSQAIVVAIAAVVAAGAVWKIFHSIPHAAVFFLAGLAVSVSLLVAR
ncbi:MAG: PTS sugar transporter subunit IIC [Gemmatimonadota bacterium]|nr:PTS sugar transporter subunit IIC [Gemmatimonadota bacterium]